MNVGFLGLGAMGALIVPRLMQAGHTITGWNRSRDKAQPLIEAGMKFAETPRAVAEQSEIVFSILTDAAAVRAVALGEDGIVSGLCEDGIYIDMSDPDASFLRMARWRFGIAVKTRSPIPRSNGRSRILASGSRRRCR